MRRTDGRAAGQAGLPALRARQAGKLLVPVLGGLAVLAMGVAAFGIVLMQQERDKRIAKERELKIVSAEREDLRARNSELEQAKAQAEEQLARTHKDLTQAQQEMAKAIEARDTLTKSVEDREREIARLTKDLEQTQSQQKQATSQLAELQSEHDTMKQQLDDLQASKSGLEAKLAEMSDHPTVQLDKVVVSDSGAGAPSMPAGTAAGSPANGQVVVINREYDFIVMNMGKNQGLAIGQQFKIVRGGEVLGTVKVEKVYDELSAAAILPESKKDAIREGDAVVAL